MCDYSLMMVPNRLAMEGEELVAHRFRSGSVGLLSCRDLDCWANRRPENFWQRLKANFCPIEPGPVVCVPPGARLRLTGVPEALQTHLPVDSYQDVVFTQLSAEASWHRDALCFANGTTVLLQLLPEGQKLKVLWLSSSEDTADRGLSEPAFAA